MVGTGHGGSISNRIPMVVSIILEHIPFGMAVEVEKGFLIENECALWGIICLWSIKILDKQTQQFKEDALLT